MLSNVNQGFIKRGLQLTRVSSPAQQDFFKRALQSTLLSKMSSNVHFSQLVCQLLSNAGQDFIKAGQGN